MWETAKAKLTEEITEGRLPDSWTAAEVWGLEPVYKRVPIDNFKQNLAALRERFRNFKIAADLDNDALQSDRRLHPIEIEGRWPGSEAERLLKLDIDDGKQLTMKPSELYNLPDREPYRAFKQDQFRKHIHQEVRSRRDSLYWVALKERTKVAKEETKGRKEAKRAEEEELIRSGFGGKTVAELKDECRRRGIKISGTKAALVDRLRLAEESEKSK